MDQDVGGVQVPAHRPKPISSPRSEVWTGLFGGVFLAHRNARLTVHGRQLLPGPPVGEDLTISTAPEVFLTSITLPECHQPDGQVHLASDEG